MLIKELFELHIPELPVKTQEEIKKEKERRISRLDGT